MQTRDIAAIVRFEVTRIVRSPQGLIFLVGFLSFFAWVGLKLVDATAELSKIGDQESRDMASASLQGPFMELMAWLTDLDASAVGELLSKHPPALIGLYFAMLFATPFFSMLASFDQTASDIGSKHLRFLLLRVDRLTLFTGKTLGAMMFMAGALAVVIVVVGTMLLLANGLAGFSVGNVITYLLRIWCTAVFLSLPFVALMSLANVLVGQSFVALVIGIGFYLFIWVISTLGALMNPAMSNAAYLFPTAFKYHAISDNLGDILLAVAHQGGFTVLFVLAGYAMFRWRDV